MPYEKNSELPKLVQEELPQHAQDIYREAFNSAWEQYADPGERRDPSESREEVSHKVAWAAVKQKYEKDPKTGDWKKNEE